MKKLLILTLAICFLATSGFATLTRTLTMGDANNIVKDNANIWLYPSTLYEYPEMAVAEFCYNEDYWDKSNGGNGGNGWYEWYGEEFTNLGLHYKFGEDSPHVLGLYFSTIQPHPDFPYNMTSFDRHEAPNNHRMDLFWAYMMGENTLGVHFAYLSGSSKTENDTLVPGGEDYSERGTSGISFELGYTMMQG